MYDDGMRKTATILTLLLVGFVLWRNYGVIPKGAVLDLSEPKTNEQKELANRIKGEDFKDGDVIKTSFGYYTHNAGTWTKTKEIWD